MKNKYYVKLLYLVSFFLGSVGLMAQISGLVTSDDGPLPSASVIIEETSVGVTTDFDGRFTIDAKEGDVLTISSIGFLTQQYTVGAEKDITITLEQNILDEIVITGYGSQQEKEITSAVAQLDAEEFNKGPINSPTQLLQGKVAGLSVYNAGGDPNATPQVRIRGISTIGANQSPLYVIDGIVGASIDNVDPNDIQTYTVLKDGSAAAIYGTRGSSGVIIVTTKQGNYDEEVKYSFNSQAGISSIANRLQVASAEQFLALGGVDFGARNNWLDQVTQSGQTYVNNISIAGGFDKTKFRVSANFRDNDGIVLNTGFNQFNTRLNLKTKALNDKLTITLNSSYTKRYQNEGNPAVLKNTVIFNPTAPAGFTGLSPEFDIFPASTQDALGGFFQTVGLFDSFNPLAIAEQGRYDTDRSIFNANANIKLDVTDSFFVVGNISTQETRSEGVISRSVNDYSLGTAFGRDRGFVNLGHFRGNVKNIDVYGTYEFESSFVDITATGGYSYQELNEFEFNVSSSGFPNDDLDYAYNFGATYNLIAGNNRVSANSDRTPRDVIIAGFGRLNFVFDDAIYLNASVRREGSTRFGADNRWGIFPAVGAGVDLNNYLNLTDVDILKFRVGWGETGALPPESGLSQTVYNYANNGTINTARTGNPELRWERKSEIDFGVEFEWKGLEVSLDYYTRDISDFILDVEVEASEGVQGGRQFQNAGRVTSSGFEAAIGYQVVKDVYHTNFVFATNNNVLEEYVVEAGLTLGNLGSPGQNGTNVVLVRPGEAIGQIVGPVFAGLDADGALTFEDLNGDGEVISAQGEALNPDADITVLGNGIPKLEIGWTNDITFGNFSINAVFRAILGHSLVNTPRVFFEPIIGSQTAYNFIVTPLADPNITTAQFSSLYVEKADFLRLDNLTVAYDFDIPDNNYIDDIQLSLNGMNLFTITNYTGVDPTPRLFDDGPDVDAFGSRTGGGGILAPGIDRRSTYFVARTFTLGLSVQF